MKKLILGSLVSAFAALTFAMPAVAQHNGNGNGNWNNNRNQACNCQELARRLQGLQYVFNNINLSNSERRDLQNQYNTGLRYYNTQQDATCSRGNQAVDRAWRRWQPVLAQYGVDYTPSCQGGNGNHNPGPGNGGYGTFSTRGDQGCPARAWRTADRAQHAIDLIAGHNAQRYYRVTRAGNSCYTYVCTNQYYCRQ